LLFWLDRITHADEALVVDKRSSLQRDLNPGKTPVLCCQTRFRRLLVMPVYGVFDRLVMM
jgi:hypothetical protein